MPGFRFTTFRERRSTDYPRFNMPLELGVDIGCRRFSGNRSDKTSLILVRELFEHHKFISDIAGQDPVAHDDNPSIVIRKVRDWLRTESGERDVPGPKTIARRYEQFRHDLPEIANTLGLEVGEMTFIDFTYTIEKWFLEVAQVR